MSLNFSMRARAVEEVFVDFLEQTAVRNDLKLKLLSVRDRILKVQRARRGMMLMINCKMQVLIKIWNREYNSLYMQAITSKDKKIKGTVGDLTSIKNEVKMALLKKYLYMCSIKHSLAFF